MKFEQEPLQHSGQLSEYQEFHNHKQYQHQAEELELQWQDLSPLAYYLE